MSVELSDLQQQIKDAGSCVVLEVTTSLNSSSVRGEKKRQLKTRKIYIERLGTEAEKVPKIYTGLMFKEFTHEGQIEGLNKGSIDFILQIPPYESERFRKVCLQEVDKMRGKRKKTFEQLLTCIDAGENIEALINNLSAQGWEKFFQRFPDILGPNPTINDFYSFGVYGVAGGNFLELYARSLCEDEVPTAIVHGPQTHAHRSLGIVTQCKEIDLLLVGSRFDLLDGLNDPKLFTRHHKEPAY